MGETCSVRFQNGRHESMLGDQEPFSCATSLSRIHVLNCRTPTRDEKGTLMKHTQSTLLERRACVHFLNQFAERQSVLSVMLWSSSRYCRTVCA